MTPHDWAQLSDWVDGALSPAERAAFDARLAAEPELAQAAARLRVLHRTASSLTPTDADVKAWNTRRPRGWFGLALLVVLVGGALLVAPRVSSSSHHTSNSLDETRVNSAAALDEAVPFTTPDASPTAEGVAPAVERDLPLVVVAPEVSPAQVTSPDGGSMRSFRHDAAVPIAVAAVLVAGVADAGAPDAGAPTVVRINPGDSWRVLTPMSELTLTPAEGFVTLRALSNSTLVMTKQPGRGRLVATPTDGGVTREYELRVEAQRDLEHTVLLEKGAKRVVWAPGRQRWSLASKVVASVTEDGDRLSVVGEAAGETTLEVWFDDGAHLTWPIRVEAGSGDGELRLSSGTQKVVTLATDTRARVEDSTIVRVMPMGTKQVLLIGVTAGETTLVLTRGDEVISRRHVVVSRPVTVAAPPVSTTVQLEASQQGPWRVRIGASLELVVKDVASVGTAASFLGTKIEDGRVLVWGSAPGLAVVRLRFTDGSERSLSVAIDP